MKRVLVFHPERCLMCLSCVLACQLKALGVEDPRDSISGRKPPQRLSMVLVEGTPWASRCRHCLQAPCAEACISGSIVRDEESSAVLHHPETCVGCGTCQLVCPFHALSRDEKEDCMVKCNLCLEDQTPSCVIACQTGALALSSGDRHAQEKKRNYAKEMTGDRGNG
ncbi:MAG: 4Fe-4S binding protein [Proteobacteria bacterium]|nr:4Fe-4S binding protein [Pseudomonadota bacterium]